ncbi:TMEM175 family protein [Ulvibacter antarcticus]|uniref:Putative membrane protein n=1 Tax=Ulvibacter antarcticus TaxID=442714 RepID=A0A3L9Z0J6_9FLAO|nr:TMEM175 family protein [Ulvibacter antarcticus]RMA66386.1 putative membrane protein [Ulvibacter antarcticus]
MKTGRLEAFSDGVLAIVITIMVLELKAPEEPSLEGILHILPILISYVLSFIYVGIYWNNHHHLMQVTEKVNGGILWANLHLLFWLSLIPFATSWINEHQLTAVPIALYGVVLLMSSVAYRILEISLLRFHDDNHPLKTIVKMGVKENLSTVIYLVAIPLAFVNVWISIAGFVIVAIMWVIPDRKLEKAMMK